MLIFNLRLDFFPLSCHKRKKTASKFVIHDKSYLVSKNQDKKCPSWEGGMNRYMDTLLGLLFVCNCLEMMVKVGFYEMLYRKSKATKSF